jgi:hypothetical protein
MSADQLKLRVLDAVHGRVFFCGPPVVMAGRLEEARREIEPLRTRPALSRVLIRYIHARGSRLSSRDIVRLARVFQQVEAIHLRQTDGDHSFQVTTASGDAIRVVSGVVGPTGDVTIQSSERGARPMCPICLARSVTIATPSGAVPVQDVRVGMSVWSADRSGRRIRGIVLRTRRVPADGELLRITLADGRTVVVSPRHPAASGRLVGALVPGDRLAGSRVAAVTVVRYRGFTYDVLPSGPTGEYFADGILLGSTLGRAA